MPGNGSLAPCRRWARDHVRARAGLGHHPIALLFGLWVWSCRERPARTESTPTRSEEHEALLTTPVVADALPRRPELMSTLLGWSVLEIHRISEELDRLSFVEILNGVCAGLTPRGRNYALDKQLVDSAEQREAYRRATTPYRY